MQHINKHNDKQIKKQFDNLEYNLKSIPITKVLDRMGFPINWEDIADIDEKVFEDEK